MRDLVLASNFKNDYILFATRELEGNINHKISENSYDLHILKTNDLDELDDLIKNKNINYLIIDNYSIDYNFEEKIKKLNPSLKILSFDDTYERHYCDELLNHNICADEKKYKNLVPNNCKIMCGKKYTLLRDEFLELKNISKKTQSITFFIAMGGADHKNKNIKILKVLKKIKKEKYHNIHANIVTTQANKNLNELIKFCKNKKWIKLFINSKSIASIMVNSSIAIVTPSVTINEICYLNMPLIAIKTASNQIDMYNYLKKRNKNYVLKKFNKNELENKIYRTIRNYIGKH